MNRKAFLSKAGILTAGFLLSGNRLFALQTAKSSIALWLYLIDYARWCPSPHNVQPWRLKIISGGEAHLYYDPARVPGVVDDKTSFTIVGMGMFLECLQIAAAPRGYAVSAIHEEEERLHAGSGELRLFARLFLERQHIDGQLNPELILRRRTSRLHYDGRIIPSTITSGYEHIAGLYGHQFVGTSDGDLIADIIRLNTDTILERAGDAATMEEMRKWIRTSAEEAAVKKDGLWSSANATSDKMMHNFFYHQDRFNHGWKRKLVRGMLNKGMKGTGNIAWIKGPFDNRPAWLQAGAMLQRLWLEMTRQGIYMQPLGTVITTPAAKERFLSMTGQVEKEGTIWFLVRFGYSREPARSYRLEVKDILMA